MVLSTENLYKIRGSGRKTVRENGRAINAYATWTVKGRISACVETVLSEFDMLSLRKHSLRKIAKHFYVKVVVKEPSLSLVLREGM